MRLPAPIIAAHIRHTGRYAAVSEGWARTYPPPTGYVPPSEWEGWDHVQTFRLSGDWLRAFRGAQAGEPVFTVQPVALPGVATPQVVAWSLLPLGDGSVLCIVVDPLAVAEGLAELQEVAHG